MSSNPKGNGSTESDLLAFSRPMSGVPLLEMA
jgi:hypothetical protein